MDTNADTRRAIEAIILVADSPVEPGMLAQLLELPKTAIEATCDELAAEYEAQGRGFVLARVAGGYRFQTHPDAAPYIERFVLDGQSSRLSTAALETLAIVAYKQPISRIQIAAIRGVNVDGVMRTLQQRGYIDETGRDPGPGNATLFGTTSLFLERLGLDNLGQLPPLGAFVPGADVVEALEEGLRPEPLVGATPPTTPAPVDLDETETGADTETVEVDLVAEETVSPPSPTPWSGRRGNATAKTEPVIEITVAMPPPAAPQRDFAGQAPANGAPPDDSPFRSAPGHDGAGDLASHDTSSRTSSRAPAAETNGAGTVSGDHGPRPVGPVAADGAAPAADPSIVEDE